MSRLFNSSAHDRSWNPSAHTLPSKAFKQHVRDDTPPRSHTSSLFDATVDNSATVVHDGDAMEDDSIKAAFKEAYRRTEARLAGLFDLRDLTCNADNPNESLAQAQSVKLSEQVEPVAAPAVAKKSTRNIEEDNYDDDEEEEDEDEFDDSMGTTPKKSQGSNVFLSPSKSGSSPINSDRSPGRRDSAQDEIPRSQPKTSEDARKQLEESKRALEDEAKRSFYTKFYTFENDRVAMLEQRKLEESEKQIDAEMDNGAQNHQDSEPNAAHGSLSNANLGASSLTLKHLIARIDVSRNKVHASDLELRNLINEVRKNRSKWASEENVNQEELYEACDKVLSELKALTEYSTPFLTRVNKREAPDYYNGASIVNDIEIELTGF